MEDILSTIIHNSGIMSQKERITMFDNHSYHRFLVSEDIRPQEHSLTEAKGDVQSPQRTSVQHAWHTPFTTSPSSSSYSSTPSSPDIKHEPLSPTNTIVHPFSIDTLIGDVIDKKDNLSRPAEVFHSTYLTDAVNRYRMTYEAIAYNMNRDNRLNSIQTLRDTELNVFHWCHFCNAFCINTEDARRHRVAHVANRDKCRLRSALYRQYGCVTVHERLDEDRIQCGLCEKVVSNCFFTKHQRIHEGHFCEECGKEFSTNSRLRDHKNTHTGQTPFTCKICDRQFAKRSSWTQHQRYHRDHRSFTCQYCKKRFNSKYACAVHERLHTGENPYKCEYPGCNRTYPQKIQLKLHMNSH